MLLKPGSRKMSKPKSVTSTSSKRQWRSWFTQSNRLKYLLSLSHQLENRQRGNIRKKIWATNQKSKVINFQLWSKPRRINRKVNIKGLWQLGARHKAVVSLVKEHQLHLQKILWVRVMMTESKKLPLRILHQLRQNCLVLLRFSSSRDFCISRHLLTMKLP